MKSTNNTTTILPTKQIIKKGMSHVFLDVTFVIKQWINELFHLFKKQKKHLSFRIDDFDMVQNVLLDNGAILSRIIIYINFLVTLIGPIHMNKIIIKWYILMVFLNL